MAWQHAMLKVCAAHVCTISYTRTVHSSDVNPGPGPGAWGLQAVVLTWMQR